MNTHRYTNDMANDYTFLDHLKTYINGIVLKSINYIDIDIVAYLKRSNLRARSLSLHIYIFLFYSQPFYAFSYRKVESIRFICCVQINQATTFQSTRLFHANFLVNICIPLSYQFLIVECHLSHISSISCTLIKLGFSV